MFGEYKRVNWNPHTSCAGHIVYSFGSAITTCGCFAQMSLVDKHKFTMNGEKYADRSETEKVPIHITICIATCDIQGSEVEIACKITAGESFLSRERFSSCARVEAASRTAKEAALEPISALRRHTTLA